MSHSRYVALPSGLKYRLYDPPDKDRVRVVDDVLISRWEEYCNSNWLSDNHEAIDAPEKKVKRFLDGCADFILYCNADGVESDYKKMKRGKVEIPMSACPSHMENLISSLREKVDDGQEAARFAQMLDKLGAEKEKEPDSQKSPTRKKQKSMFSKVQKVKAAVGPADYSFCRVDTENNFSFGGTVFNISKQCERYRPKETEEGRLYDYDKIIVAMTHDGKLWFFDPTWEEIGIQFINQI